jgi:hypothetical protein
LRSSGKSSKSGFFGAQSAGGSRFMPVRSAALKASIRRKDLVLVDLFLAAVVAGFGAAHPDGVGTRRRWPTAPGAKRR